MDGNFTLVTVMISVLLFLVMFFGIGFLVNMLLRMTWLMAIVYPIVVILIIDEVGFLEYFSAPAMAFQALGDKLISLHFADVLILSSGLVGAIIAGIVIKMLRKNGYQMF